ncbi:unnamed protein product, partial [Discosporangium mesarthrocarpum]
GHGRGRDRHRGKDDSRDRGSKGSAKEDKGRASSHPRQRGLPPALAQVEASLRVERQRREELEGRCERLHEALTNQLERDAEALERMDELARQARKERDKTNRDRTQLQERLHTSERKRSATEKALRLAEAELEEAKRNILAEGGGCCAEAESLRALQAT